MTLDITHSNSQPADSDERATAAEMKFAGHYLNFFGMFLLVVGIVSYFKSAGASNGLLQSLLGAALGVVLLGAGEYFFSRGYTRYSHPLLTGGFCLLFFAVCSAHFRHNLMSQEAMFGWLLLIVICSNASVFRHNSKLIGNVMLTVYFLTPIFMTFSFQNFTTIFLYLLAINLGATVVAFYKRWDFQLTVSALGSYAFYFAHFRTGIARDSLLFLLAVYGLSLVVNYLLYFIQPESGDSNLLLSLVSQVIFIVLSALVVMALPNWCRVTVYAILALVQVLVAVTADGRRARHPNFEVLATGSLILALLYLSVCISFVTYFSESTRFFGLVTFLWFCFALTTLELSIRIQRHRPVLSRFSYFGLVLGAVQVMYVLPSMQASEAIQMLGLALYWIYFCSFFLRRHILEDQPVQALSGTAVAGFFLTFNTVTTLLTPLWATVCFSGLAAIFFLVKIEPWFPWLRIMPYVMGSAALYSSSFLPSSLTTAATLGGLILAMGLALEYALQGGRKCGEVWFWIGLLGVRIAYIPRSLSDVLIALAFVHLLGKLVSLKLTRGDVLNRTVELSTLLIVLILYSAGPPPLPTLAAVVSVLILSQVLQFTLDGDSTRWDMGFCLVLLIVLVYQSYQPYPVACLALGAVLALALVGLDTTFAVCLQTVIACGSLYLPFRNTTLGFALLVALLAAVSFRVVRSQSGCMAWSAAATLLVFLKWTLMLDQGPFSTLCWAAAAVGLLYYAVTHEELGRWNECNGGLFDYSRLLYFLSFVKAITFDTNFVGRLQPLEYPLTFLVGSLFLASGHLLIRKRDVRNLFLVLGLMICCFQLTFILHSWWGDRMYFQPLLSGFWSAVSLVVIAIGISLNLKVYRLFGLVMLVANTAKILLVDIHVLDSYSQTNTFLILGVLLMTTSFLYHRRREDLCPERSAARLCVTS